MLTYARNVKSFQVRASTAEWNVKRKLVIEYEDHRASDAATFVDQLAGQKDQRAVKNALDAWFDEVRKATWSGAAEVKRHYSTASIISAERVVFNIKGNDYRLVVAVDYQKGIVWIKWLGSHADYDQIDVAKVSYGSRAEADPN